ncbi:MAG: alpha/beta hydrolase [Clostridium sp.]|nr:alpha/beta hydrolase [Clostridium sp.]MCI6987231.1 alpha/beta hydrolase [Clostridium sp.]
MELSQKFVRKQMEKLKPLSEHASLETCRRSQDILGSILAKTMRSNVDIHDAKLSNCEVAWIYPHDELKKGIILYLHGGGYTCGDLEYAKGFGSVLSGEFGIRVMCLAYRLAPENPYPAAVDDALEAYRLLLTNGYLPGQIVLAGESAGGGLCYALCRKLKELRIPLPACIVTCSPWMNLKNDGETFESNREIDPSLSKEQLDFYAECYTANEYSLEDPMISPLFGELDGFPPSIIFVGSDELLLDDSVQLHKKLCASGSSSELIVADGMWHAYVLFCIKERACDIRRIDAFLNRYLNHERKLRWMRLDNAAKIFPAAKRRRWNNFFRLSATLTEQIDTSVLQTALDVTARRFPSIAVRLCKGLFWYYLEELQSAPDISEEAAYPLVHTPFESINECALRVIVYKNRIAVEFYHALTDGSGGLIFLKTLLAEYLEQKYKISVPNELGVLDRHEEPSEEEIEDSFEKYNGPYSAPRDSGSVYSIRYTREPDDFRHLTTLIADVPTVRACAKKRDVTVTVFLASAMLLALQRVQNEQVPNKRRQKPLRVVIPVNLRRIFPSKTLRNFVQVVLPEINPRMGDYEFDEICSIVKYEMGLQATKKNMQAKFTPNVNASNSTFLRLTPLFAKNIVMKAIYDSVGERTSCLNVSNLGNVEIPEVMRDYISRFDFVLGLQASKPNNCGVISYGGKLYMNMIRNTVEPCLEYHFFKVLQELGIHVLVESNMPRDYSKGEK